MRRFLVVFALVLAPSVASAQYVTVRDILELSKAGLGEEALLALIEVNQPVFSLDVAALKSLKDSGVPSKVITAMIRSGRTQPIQEVQRQPVEPDPTPMPPAAPAPQVVVIEHHEEPVVREVPVAYPVYVTVPTRRIHRGIDHPSKPVNPNVAPVFWGWGGKLRPDAWQPAIEPQRDAKVPLVPQRK